MRSVIDIQNGLWEKDVQQTLKGQGLDVQRKRPTLPCCGFGPEGVGGQVVGSPIHNARRNFKYNSCEKAGGLGVIAVGGVRDFTKVNEITSIRFQEAVCAPSYVNLLTEDWCETLNHRFFFHTS